MQALYIPCAVHGHARDLASQVALFAARQIRTPKITQWLWFFFLTPFEIGSDTCYVHIGNRRFIRWRKR